MNVDELMSRAWAAVQASGVPEPLQAVALKEAIDFLRAEESPPEKRKQRQGQKQKARTGNGKSKEREGTENLPDEATAFERLADESGVGEDKLRDILQVTHDGNVHVTTPTKDLGNNLAEQARTVLALVTSARAIGLGESPVSADAVRAELRRKRCYDGDNFSGHHLGPLKGFNAGAKRSEIVTTSKWLEDFKAAVVQAHGGDPEQE